MDKDCFSPSNDKHNHPKLPKRFHPAENPLREWGEPNIASTELGAPYGEPNGSPLQISIHTKSLWAAG